VRSFAGTVFLAALAGTVVPLWSQPAGQRPVGLVMVTSGVLLQRSGTALPLDARVGDLLYEGDTLLTETGSAWVAHCAAKERYGIAPGSTAVMERSQIRMRAGRISAREALPVCVLPPVTLDRLGEVRFYGTRLARPAARPEAGSLESRVRALSETGQRRLRAELEPVDAVLARDAGDTAARLARGAILESFGLRPDAAAEYRRVSEAWSDVDWPRKLVHEQEEAERRAGGLPAPEEKPGKTFALVVGISKYPHLKSEEQLQFAHRDAAVFADFLRSPRGGALPEEQIRTLTNEQATTAATRNSIASFLRARAGKQDTVILFIAAHGVVDSRGAYVVTYDSNVEDLQTTALPMLEVQRLFEEEFAHVGRVLLYVDVCRAGAIGTIRHNAIGRFVDLLLAGEAAETLGLLASRPGEVSVEHERFGGGHGAFSYFLLRGLNGDADENRNGEIDAGELIEYVRAKVREATRNRQTPRETGTLPASSVLARNLDQPGIQVADWKPLEVFVAQGRELAGPHPSVPAGAAEDLNGFFTALREGRILPDVSGSAFLFLPGLREKLKDQPETLLELENRLRVALQDQGQQVVLRYLRGEQVPQRKPDFAAGEQSFRASLELDPGASALLSRALFCRGRAMIFDRQYAEARQLLERAARIDPQGAYILNALGIAYLEQAAYARAVLAFRDAIRLAPLWVYPVHNLALVLTEQGDYAGALRTYQQAMRLAPGVPYLPYNLALLYQRLNRRRDAEAALQRAIALAPQSAEPYDALGFLKAAAGKKSEAEALYRKSLERNPRLLTARHNLALLLNDSPARRQEAMDLWRQNIAQAPDFAPSRLSLAEAFAREEKYADAVREYEELIRLRPDSVSARLALAEVLLKLGRTEPAIVELETALKQKPNNPVVLERLGDAEMQRGQPAEAGRAYRAALEAATDSSMRKRIRSKIP
jgi:tetratricopeptide (TPR) repeat protein